MIDDVAILYVEDDQLSREGLEILLRRLMGVKDLWIFEDSADFMPRFKALPRKPDIVLLDVHMKPYNGFEMLYMLRADPEYARTTVLALTASVMNEEVETLRSSGFNGAISKPINVQSFPGLLTRAIQGEPVWSIG